MVNVDESKETMTKEETRRRIRKNLFRKYGSRLLRNYRIPKIISKERIFKILVDFITKSVLELRDGDQGGYLDYYLVNADRYSNEELLDYVMFFATIDHVNRMIMNEDLKDRKSFCGRLLLHYSNAEVFMEYKFHRRWFRKWQKQLYNILTLRRLPS